MRQNERGLTLVELLIAITVSVILGGAIMGFMTEQLRTSTIASAKQELLSDAQIGLDKVSYDIRLSADADGTNRWQDANAPLGGNPYSWQSDSSHLVLATAAQDSNHNILFDDASKYITNKNNLIYFVSNGTLYRRTLASDNAANAAKTTCPANLATSTCPADSAILHNVSAFSIAYHDGDDNAVTPTDARSVIISVTMTITKYGQPISASYSTRMVFRND